MRTISLVSRKGGSGKSMLAIHLAVCAARRRQRVVVLDLDPQGSILRWSARRDDNPRRASAVVTVERARAREVPTLLSSAREQGADLVLIDTPGVADVDTARVVQIADFVLCPVRPFRADCDAAEETAAGLKLAGARAAFVLNAVPPRGTRHAEAREELAPLGVPVAPVELHQLMAFADAQNDGSSVEELDPKGKASAEVRALYAWILKQCDERRPA